MCMFGLDWVLGKGLCLSVGLTMMAPCGVVVLESVCQLTPPLSMWILEVKSLSMLDGQQRAYVMFLPEGVIFTLPCVIPTLLASFSHQSF